MVVAKKDEKNRALTRCLGCLVQANLDLQPIESHLFTPASNAKTCVVN